MDDSTEQRYDRFRNAGDQAMSFQILGIAVYNADGEKREVEFKRGAVNIITGASKTGKSALIQIIDYCLGRNDYLIPAGKIRKTVVWYALRLTAESTEVIIARPAPARGVQSNTEAFFTQGTKLAFPKLEELKKTTNTAGLEKFLTELVGITANRNVPKDGHSRDPLTANIKHAKFLLFQPQYRIADQTSLFYRQEEISISQAIKDTLPYFLGAVGDERFDQVQTLRRARRKLKLLKKRLEEEDAIRGEDNSRAVSLLAEAQQVGVITDYADDELDLEDLLNQLKTCSVWKPESPGHFNNEGLRELREEREDLEIRLDNTHNEIDAARAFALAQQGFGQEVKEQKSRLESIGLYKSEDNDGHVCPLCESTLESPIPTTENIEHSLAKINEQIQTVVRQQPRLEKYLNERLDLVEDLKQKIAENLSALNAVFDEQQELKGKRSRVAAQAKVVGRISLFLDSVVRTEEESDLQSRIKSTSKEVERLEKEVSDERLDERMEISLGVIGANMTTWAKKLGLEHSEFPFNLDVKNLTVRGYDETEAIPMSKMGSAANWVGCHIIAHLALHSWFVNHERPVPRFLILDQPTQAYFPPDENVLDRSVDDLKDEDREAVEKMFKLIFSVVRKLKKQFQVIITDHADLDDDKFQSAVTERWRSGVALIPDDWS